MEKRDCGIVRDLMPLVIDQVASPASTELVENHIRECEECREPLPYAYYRFCGRIRQYL